MNGRDDAAAGVLEALEAPRPTPDLERRVLTAARTALEVPPAHDRWSALRWSRPLRIAWAAAVVLLALGNLLLPRQREALRTPPGPTLASSHRAASGELAEVARLPRIDADARSLGSLISALESAPAEPELKASGADRREGGAR